MTSTWFLLLTILATLSLIIMGVIRSRNFRRKEQLHRQLAKKFGMEIAYMNERNFTIFGTHHNYPVHINAFKIKPDSTSKKHWGLKISVPMVNPNRKSLLILKQNAAFPDVNSLVIIDKALKVKHDMGADFSILTNDMIFTSLILSDEVKISIADTFKDLPAGIVFIQDEELSFVSPFLLKEENQLEPFTKAIELLADMKAELN